MKLRFVLIAVLLLTSVFVASAQFGGGLDGIDMTAITEACTTDEINVFMTIGLSVQGGDELDIAEMFRSMAELSPECQTAVGVDAESMGFDLTTLVNTCSDADFDAIAGMLSGVPGADGTIMDFDTLVASIDPACSTIFLGGDFAELAGDDTSDDSGTGLLDSFGSDDTSDEMADEIPPTVDLVLTQCALEDSGVVAEILDFGGEFGFEVEVVAASLTNLSFPCLADLVNYLNDSGEEIEGFPEAIAGVIEQYCPNTGDIADFMAVADEEDPNAQAQLAAGLDTTCIRSLVATGMVMDIENMMAGVADITADTLDEANDALGEADDALDEANDALNELGFGELLGDCSMEDLMGAMDFSEGGDFDPFALLDSLPEDCLNSLMELGMSGDLGSFGLGDLGTGGDSDAGGFDLGGIDLGDIDMDAILAQCSTEDINALLGSGIEEDPNAIFDVMGNLSSDCLNGLMGLGMDMLGGDSADLTDGLSAGDFPTDLLQDFDITAMMESCSTEDLLALGELGEGLDASGGDLSALFGAIANLSPDCSAVIMDFATGFMGE